MTSEITLKELADRYNFNVNDVMNIEFKKSNTDRSPYYEMTGAIKLTKPHEVKIDIQQAPHIQILLKNGDWINILNNEKMVYNTNNPSIHKALTTELHGLREQGIREKEESDRKK